MRLAAIRDLWRRVIAAQIEEKPEPIGKTENRIEYQIRKPVNSFRGKRKPNAKIRKMRKPQRTPKVEKTEVFWHKHRITDLKYSQNRKTENPDAPLLITREKLI